MEASHESDLDRSLASGGRTDGSQDLARAGAGAAQATKERAGALWDDAKEAARTKLNEQKDAAAQGIGQVAGALRNAAHRQNADDASEPVASLTDSAAEGLERLSNTLQGTDVGVMLRDMEGFARSQPVAFFGLALATGFLAARFLKGGNG